MRSLLELARRLEDTPQRLDEELDLFVRTHQFPIVDGDTATFFYLSDGEVDEVYLVHWVFGLESRQRFLRLGQTDAWYLPLELPHGGRVEYKIECVVDGRRVLVRDPLNERKAYDPFGSNSVCPMPGYTEPAWSAEDPNAATGKVESFEVDASSFGDRRTVSVYLPAEFKAFKAYPLLICHDGRDYLRFAGLKGVLDNLIDRHEVAPLIVALVDGEERNREFGANPTHASFIAEDLLPALEARYRLAPGPANRGLMGASFGAVASLFTAWSHPGTFGRLLLQSGSFVFTDVGDHDRGPLFDPVVAFINGFREEPGRFKARVFQSCGVFESLIYYNRSLRPVFREAGFELRYAEALDGHNWVAWRDRLREGLSWLFPGPLWMYYE